MEFAERLRQLRERTGLNQNAFAKEADVPQPVVYRLEAGIRGVGGLTVAVAQKLARTLGVSVDHLIGMYDDDRHTSAQRSSRRKKPREPALEEEDVLPFFDDARPSSAAVKHEQRQWLRQQDHEQRRRLKEGGRQANHPTRFLELWRAPGKTAQAIFEMMGREYAWRLAQELHALVHASRKPQKDSQTVAGAAEQDDLWPASVA